MNKAAFNDEVYSIVREIPPGNVITYGQIARLLGRPKNSRMVGQAMHNAPENGNLPCHRVVNCVGRLVPGWHNQRILLETEGVKFKENGCVDLKHCGWEDIDFSR